MACCVVAQPDAVSPETIGGVVGLDQACDLDRIDRSHAAGITQNLADFNWNGKQSLSTRTGEGLKNRGGGVGGRGESTADEAIMRAGGAVGGSVRARARVQWGLRHNVRARLSHQSDGDQGVQWYSIIQSFNLAGVEVCNADRCPEDPTIE